ncbi:MAG: ABC transporter substrate-binding protein [Bradymonadales bacterium]
MAEEVNNTAKSEGESVILPKPMDFAKSTYKKLLKLNEEPPSEARNAAIIKLSDELFDYKKIAANTLGEKWDALEESQQNELHSLFKQLLELNYIDRISQKNFKQNYKIDWDKATKNKNTAIVTCFIQQKDVETELDFHLYASDKLWKLNNIHIDGVSLTNTYWKKYGKHYDEKGYDGLVKEMKAQIEKLEKAKTKK